MSRYSPRVLPEAVNYGDMLLGAANAFTDARRQKQQAGRRAEDDEFTRFERQAALDSAGYVQNPDELRKAGAPSYSKMIGASDADRAAITASARDVSDTLKREDFGNRLGDLLAKPQDQWSPDDLRSVARTHPDIAVGLVERLTPKPRPPVHGIVVETPDGQQIVDPTQIGARFGPKPKTPPQPVIMSVTGPDGQPSLVGVNRSTMTATPVQGVTPKRSDSDAKFDLVAPGVESAAEQYTKLGPASQTEMVAIRHALQDPKNILTEAGDLLINPSLPDGTKARLGALYTMASGFNKLTGKDNPTEHFARMRSYVLNPGSLDADMTAIRAHKRGGSPAGPAASAPRAAGGRPSWAVPPGGE